MWKRAGGCTVAVTMLLGGCGLDTVGAAATGAAVKQQEVQQGQAQLQQVQQQLQKSNELTQQQQQALEDATR